MSDNQTGPFQYIDSPQSLLELSRKLSISPWISVDTESNSLYVYREQVCLVQISTADCDYLIDPLALKDLSPLASIFANPRQEKIFHAAEYDIICLKRDYGFTISNIFDTMVAARILGETAVGLASLLQSRLNIEVEKKYQRANWGIRPLSLSMLAYARQDSHYLYRLRVLLEKELKEKKLWDLALEDFRLGCEVSAHPQSSPSPSCWKVAGSIEISPVEAAILQSLCDFREVQAQKQNVPPFKILSNEILVHLCKEPPTEISELVNTRGITQHLIQRFGAELFAAIQRGQASPPLLRPMKVRPDDRFLRRLDALKEWRKLKGKELKVESDVILPRDFLEVIAAENPESSQSLHAIMARIPWRYQHFSKEIFSLLRKQEVV
jgi:ribonuclease D